MLQLTTYFSSSLTSRFLSTNTLNFTEDLAGKAIVPIGIIENKLQ